MNTQQRVLAAILLLIVSFARAQTVEYIHTDALGSPVAVTNASGAVIERTVYEPYGAVINRPVTNGPGYTGHVMDATTGLNYMQQRYYDPQVGRFLSNDPVTATSAGANFNRYRYANNNPYGFVDPDGRQAGQTDCRSPFVKCYGGSQEGGGSGGSQASSASSTVDGMLATPSAQRMNAYFDAALSGDLVGALSAGLDVIKGEWSDAYSTPEGAILTTMSMVPVVGMEAATARSALAAPRQIAASWGASVYRHGGLMTGIEHIIYRHGFKSGFSGVSRFTHGTRIRDISNYVDNALRYGRVTSTYPGGYMVEHNLGRVIGFNPAGNPVSNIRIYVRDGIIQTAFPF